MKKILTYIAIFLFSTSMLGQKQLKTAENLITKGEYNQAKSLLETLLQEDTKNAEANYLMGYSELSLSNSHKALNYFKKAYLYDSDSRYTTIKVDEHIPKLLYLLTADLKPVDKEHLIINLSDELLKDSPSNPLLMLQKADAYDALSYHNKSNSTYMAIVQTVESLENNYKSVGAQACFSLADEYYFRQADVANANLYIDKGLVLEPGNKKLSVLRLIISEREKKSEPITEERFIELLSTYPNNEKLLLLYAKHLEDKKPFESITQYEKLLNLDKTNKEALYALGKLYTTEASKMQSNNENPKQVYELMNTGIKYMEILHNLNPNDQLTIETLIRFYGYVNRFEDAEKMKLKLK